MLTHFSLFSGIGGIDLAAEWAGFTTVGQVEWADYPTKVLEKHWPDVPRWRDIRSVTAEDFYNRTGLRTVDLISGGFPCQPFSVAGKQKGKRDDRYLWPEMLRVISEIKPTWVLGENVPGILSIAGKTVCEDLEREGYAVTVFNFEAAAVGAPHRRDRVFFVAHSSITERPNCPSKANVADTDHTGNRTPASRIDGNGQEKNKGWEEQPFVRTCRCGQNVANTSCKLREWDRRTRDRRSESPNGSRRAVESGLGMLVDGLSYWLDGYWRVEPDIPRIATGVKNRVDRLKCLGNAVVPQQVYPILKAIAEIDRWYKKESEVEEDG
jgi:DNA (cytosine-5)-methyltransferase 1